MSTLVFDGNTHLIELFSDKGQSLGKWAAFNNIDSAVAKAKFQSMKHLTDGTYGIQDPDKPHLHPGDSSNGKYGKYGIIRFYYPGHNDIGVHSGKANWPKQPGPRHATKGCIRTTDEAMAKIKDVMATDPLQNITIMGNNANSVTVGERKHAAGRRYRSVEASAFAGAIADQVEAVAEDVRIRPRLLVIPAFAAKTAPNGFDGMTWRLKGKCKFAGSH